MCSIRDKLAGNQWLCRRLNSFLLCLVPQDFLVSKAGCLRLHCSSALLTGASHVNPCMTDMAWRCRLEPELQRQLWRGRLLLGGFRRSSLLPTGAWSAGTMARTAAWAAANPAPQLLPPLRWLSGAGDPLPGTASPPEEHAVCLVWGICSEVLTWGSDHLPGEVQHLMMHCQCDCQCAVAQSAQSTVIVSCSGACMQHLTVCRGSETLQPWLPTLSVCCRAVC